MSGGKPGRRWKPENLQPCGSDAAYQRHLYHHEPPCGPCEEAHRRCNDALAYRRGRGHVQPAATDALLRELIHALAELFEPEEVA